VDAAPIKKARSDSEYLDQFEDAYGALDYLAVQKSIDKDNMALMGFSAGGITINRFHGQEFRSPQGRQFKAAISLYGMCKADFGAKQFIPLSIIIGDKELPDKLQGCLENVGKKTEIEINLIKGAYHAFDKATTRTLTYGKFGNPTMYSASAHRKSEELVKAFLAKHFGK